MNFHLQVRQDSGWRIRRSVDRMSEEKEVLREAEVAKVTKITESEFSDPNHLK